MQLIMDRLMESLTEIDNVIRRQGRAMATVNALSNMSDLMTARKHVRSAQHALVHIDGDALPDRTSPMQTEGP